MKWVKGTRACLVAYLCQLGLFLWDFSVQYVVQILIVASGWVAIRSLLSFWASGQLIFSSKAKTILLVWWPNLVRKEGISTVWVFTLIFHLWGSLGLNRIWWWRSSFEALLCCSCKRVVHTRRVLFLKFCHWSWLFILTDRARLIRSLLFLISDLDIIKLFKLWQFSDHMLSIASNSGHWILSKPDDFQIFQRHQMLNFI